MNEHTNEGGYRDPSIDVLKGLAIILVVYGHTWPFCREFIYLFHMAIFMMASGFCWKTSIGLWKDWGKYTVKKLKALYIPFVICNGAFILFSPVFLRFGFYTNNSTFLLISESWPVSQRLYGSIDLLGILKHLIRTFLFIGPTQLGTATWFLTSLFVVLVVHASFELLLSKFDEKRKNLATYVLLIIMLALTQIISTVKLSLLYPIKCFPCTYVAFLFGLLLKRVSWSKLYSWWMGIIAFGILLLLNRYFSIEVSAGRIGNIGVYIVVSLSGWIMLKSLSDLMCKVKGISGAFSYIGKHTMPILCLHVLCFKAVSWLYITVTNAPKVLLASWHIIFGIGEGWKLLYVFSGVAIPLMLHWVYMTFRYETVQKKTLYR